MPELKELQLLLQYVRADMESLGDEPSPNLKSLFPAMWCEYASIVLAEVLKQQGFGLWTFVIAGEPEFLNGHAWLELRDEHDVRRLTIDATVDQFKWANGGPFVSRQQTPAARVFSMLRYEGPWEEWPVLEYDYTYRSYLEAFMNHTSLT